MRNWEKYQHYKSGKRATATPAWIKLYGRLLRDYDFVHLEDATKWHFVGILLLAAEHDNRIPADPLWITRELGSTVSVDLAALLSAGLVETYTDASKVVTKYASKAFDEMASPEVEVEVEREVEVEVEVNPLVREDADPDLDTGETIKVLHQHFNAVRGGKPLKLTTERRTKYRTRLKTFTPAEIVTAIDNALSDPFYRGENDRNTRFDFPETVLKNDAAVDRHLARGEKRDPVLERAARWSKALDA